MSLNVKVPTTNEMVRRILSLDEYKGKVYLRLCDIAQIYFNGNTEKARAFIAGKGIAHYSEPYGSAKGKKGVKMYNIYEVQEAVTLGRWQSG